MQLDTSLTSTSKPTSIAVPKILSVSTRTREHLEGGGLSLLQRWALQFGCSGHNLFRR